MFIKIYIWAFILFIINILFKIWEINIIFRIILNLIFLFLVFGFFFICDCFKKKYKVNEKIINNSNDARPKLSDNKTNINQNIIEKLLNSQVGFYNAGGSCYMSSIIQVLIHSEVFLRKYLEKEYKDKNSLASKFYDFIKLVQESNDNIKIRYFANEFNNINYKFNGVEGNNPLKFYTEFIKELSKENDDIIELFKGKKYIKFEGIPESNYEDNFLFLMITLDKNFDNIKKALFSEKEFEEDASLKLSEEIIIKPKILLINVSHEDINYNFEEYIKLADTEYKLIAVNRYSMAHSTV